MERTTSINADGGQQSHVHDRLTYWRSWSGFWFLGLCNNFAYVVMLSAAHDILKKQESKNATSYIQIPLTMDFQGGNTSNSSRYDCNPVSTAAVLLADILPTLAIKLCAPFVIHKLPYGIRVWFCVIMAATSFLLVSFSSAVWMSILAAAVHTNIVTTTIYHGSFYGSMVAFGVIFASISSGLGELSFLALTVFFTRDVLGSWGSGTGAAGVAGASLYSGLTQVGLSPQVTLLFMLVVPFVMVISYFVLLNHPASVPQWSCREAAYGAVGTEERQQLMNESEEQEPTAVNRSGGPLTVAEKLHVVKGLLKFVVPLGLVYFAEYFINQGLMELLYFPDFFLSHAEQYRWYQTLYQIGVLVSRSSLCCVKIRKLWLLCVLQMVNAVLLLFAVRYQFLPSAWLVFVIILYEGLLGGAAYVNTFYFISKETDDRHREFAMAAASVGDSLGIALAGGVAFPVHKYFCGL